MKRVFLILLLFFMVCSCGTNINPDKETDPNDTDISDLVDMDVDSAILDNSSLTVFFGVNDEVERIADLLMMSAETSQFQIVPGVLYDEEDMDLNDPNSRINREQNDPAFRPDISNSLDLLDQYDLIFVLYPLWKDRVPNIIYSFLDAYDFSGKKLIMLAVGEKTDLSSQDFSMYSWNIKSGFYISPNAQKNDVVRWLNGLNL